MTEPLKPINTTVFGGVKVDANRVAKFSKVKQNGATRFVIDFKNGTRIEYPQQKSGNESRIRVFDTGNPSGNPRIDIENLAYGKIKGTDKNDDITLTGCRQSVVDVSGGGADSVLLRDDALCASDKNAKKSSNNKVIQDNNDETLLKTTDYYAEYRDHYFDPVKDNELYIVKGEGTVSEKDY